MSDAVKDFDSVQDQRDSDFQENQVSEAGEHEAKVEEQKSETICENSSLKRRSSNFGECTSESLSSEAIDVNLYEAGPSRIQLNKDECPQSAKVASADKSQSDKMTGKSKEDPFWDDLRSSRMCIDEEMSAEDELRPECALRFIRRFRKRRSLVNRSSQTLPSDIFPESRFYTQPKLKRSSLKVQMLFPTPYSPTMVRWREEYQKFLENLWKMYEESFGGPTEASSAPGSSTNLPDKSQKMPDEHHGEGEQCPICLQVFNNSEIGITNICNHKFCAKCIFRWSTDNQVCPYDRAPFTRITVFRNYNTIREKIYEILLTREIDFYEGEESILTSYCSFCKRASVIDISIICSICEISSHMRCLNSVMLPGNDWSCSNCNSKILNEKDHCKIKEFVVPSVFEGFPEIDKITTSFNSNSNCTDLYESDSSSLSDETGDINV